MREFSERQFNLAPPGGIVDNVSTRMREKLFWMFMREFAPVETDEVLDLGATADADYVSSNYFERLYEFKHRIVAAGIDDAKVLEQVYPGLRFQLADARSLPFEDRSFDYVHSSAVLEHVGSLEQQGQMIAECARVARKGIWLTTPNRWFPIEFHTQIPLAHWGSKSMFRALLRRLGQHELSLEENLNLLTSAELRELAKIPCWNFSVRASRLLGWKSNFILMGARNEFGPESGPASYARPS